MRKVCNDEHPSLYRFGGGFWDRNCIRCVTIWLNCIENTMQRKEKETWLRWSEKILRSLWTRVNTARSLGMSHAMRMNVTCFTFGRVERIAALDWVKCSESIACVSWRCWHRHQTMEPQHVSQFCGAQKYEITKRNLNYVRVCFA